MSSKQTSESVTEVKYRGFKYSLVVIPSSNDQIVVEQSAEIEKNLQLHELANDFKCLGLFLRIVHCGVIGHLDLVIKVRRHLNNVVTLCNDTVHAVNEFKRSSQTALDNMLTAYKYLEEDNEEEAVETFLQIKAIAKRMQDAASKLSEKCSNESKGLMLVGEAAQEKQEKFKQRNKQVKHNIEEQDEEYKINQESLAKEEKAEKESVSEFKATKSDKSELIAKRERYVEEEKQQLLDVKSNKQTATEKCQKELEQNLSQLKSSLENKLTENDKKYQAIILENETSKVTILKTNEETFEQQSKNVQDDLKESQVTNQTEYEIALQSKYTEIETEIKLKEVNFASENNDGYLKELEMIEKEYSDKVASYEAEFENTVKQSNEWLKEQITHFEDEFIKQKELHEKQNEIAKEEITASYSKKKV